MKKKKLVHQRIYNYSPAVAPTVYVTGKALKAISTFTYLVSMISSDAKMSVVLEKLV